MENKNNILIERIKYENSLDAKKMKIVLNDILLSSAEVDLGEVRRKYALVQMGMANLYAFNGKPQFYPEVESFTDMLNEGIK